VSLVAISDVALGAANYVIRCRLLVTAQGCLPACLCGVVHDRLVVGGKLGGDALWLHERGPKEVNRSFSPWALHVLSGQCN
jgi:hypothetical protein